jgi:hypothetical protein
MKLWRIISSVEVFAAFADRPDEIDCEDAIRDAGDEGIGCLIESIDEITELSEVDKAWIDSIPFGDGDNDRTCAQIINAEIEARKQAAWNAPLPNQISLPLAD